jgi:hypothetical protein
VKSREFEGLFERIRQFLHPVDDVDKSMIDREETFPFKKKSRPTTEAG